MAQGWQIFIVLMSCIGLATIGEFMEFFGALQTPDGQGFLGTEARGSPIEWLSADYWDTMKDLLVNTFGSTAGIITWYIYKIRNKLSGRFSTL